MTNPNEVPATKTKPAEHTPGPWRYEPCNAGGGLVYRAGTATEHEQFSVQIVPLADARLIAAAPELLEALNAVYNDIELDAQNENGAPGGSTELSIMVQSAIAKAESSHTVKEITP